MLYNTGTIAINGNTATGTGTNWTAPASQVRAGQTIIVMSNPVQMFQISSVNSATSMTVTPAASPALSGQKYGILVSDNISVDGLALAMSQLIKEYDENIGAWETFATTSANQNITVTINGTSLSIPALGKLLQKGSNGALPVNQGGTGATNAADARTKLGLGGAALKNTGLNPGDVQLVQVGRRDSANPEQKTWSCIYEPYQSSNLFPDSCVIQVLPGPTNSEWGEIGIGYGNSNTVYVAKASYSSSQPTGNIVLMTMYHDKNTFVDSNGFIKRASPVVKIFSDGRVETNDESEGVRVTRLDVGQYYIEGCQALNSDAAWGGIDGGFEIPTDRNKQPLIWLDYEVNADGSVLVKTYHREHPSAPAFARNERDGLADGDPVDIPADQFLSVRVEMPASSIWNQKKKQKQTEEALKQEQGS
ncbi:phage tail protein [Escherichia coli]|uniref:phage tail fiber protein n=1 Tax=Escherichia coli TaxID=562 RepID=UPI0011DE392B|nr:phage tail protein [Escherichia coli]EFL7413829.1 phage tail protein [Escherichia coli]EHH8707656.1 phage tail protein [Escherichia coli]EHN7803392.1 phage tail protein [Escherichia coli]EHO3204223.1 phage tail protein [Escherichia coli]EKG7012102.1 phage tail protein [Escherichia coli]